MSSTVHQLKPNEIQKILASLPKNTNNTLPPGAIYKNKINGHTILMYKSNKFMVQGAQSEMIANDILLKAGVTNTANNENQSEKEILAINYDHFNCIGSDEAGSGDYFGPMTVVASYVSKENAAILKTLGVMDSKNLKDKQIVELAEQIITFIPHSLLTLDNPKYNERKQLGWSQVKMKAVLHNQAIKNVLSKINAPLDYIVIDQFAVQGVYERYAIGPIPEREKTKFETKGESKSIAIAASSIIARYAFVKYYDQIIKDTGIHITKGAGPKVDLEAVKIIDKKGIEYLDSITKKDFKNREKALNLYNKKK